MNKKLVFLVFLTFILSIGLKAQDCFKYFPTKKGSFYEYTDYNNKGKITGTTKRTVLDLRNIGDSSIVDFLVESKNTKSDSIAKTNFSMSCKNDIVYVNMSGFTNTGAAGFAEMDVEVNAGNIDFPTNPFEGQILKGGEMTVTIKTGGQVIMTIKSIITNRKIEAFEEITTDAGTFKTFKISYDIEVQSFLKTTGKAIEWYSEKYGLIKSESYDKNGKLTGSSVLTKFSN